MKKRYLGVIERSGLNLAVAEVPGTSLKQRLQKSRVDQKGCGKEDCLVWEEGDGKRCREDGVVYEIRYKECNDVYID